MNNHRRLRLQKSIKEFVNRKEWENPLAVTLTFKKVTGYGSTYAVGSRDQYQQNLRHFLNVLNKRIYKNKANKGKSIRCFSVMEQDQSGRCHYHILIDLPQHIIWMGMAHFIAKRWPKTRWGYKQVDVQKDTKGHWLDYMLKFRSKNEFDLSIDWENSRGL